MANNSSSESDAENDVLLPYQFEPVRSVNEGEDSDGWVTVEEEEDSDVEERLLGEGRHEVDAGQWCKCHHCQQMRTAVECICCTEMEETKLMLQEEKIACITDHPSFAAVCLHKDVLWTAMVNLADREGAHLPPRNNVPNRTYRYAAYRQFTWWVHNKLGRHVRKVIPSCAISRIRAEYEEESGDYSCFSGIDKAASEISKAMEFKVYF